MSRLLGSKAKLFVAGLSFVVLLLTTSLAIPQIAQVEPASASASGWIQGGPSMKRLIDVASSSDGLVAYATENTSYGNPKKIWKTADGGLNWIELLNSPGTNWGSIATSGNGQIVVALAWSGSDQIIYRSNDAGTNWSSVYTGAVQLNEIAMSDDGNTIVVATDSGILLSINSGTSFAPTADPLATQENPVKSIWKVIDINAQGQKLVVSSPNRTLFKSIDSGAHWTELAASGSHQWDMVAISNDGLTIMGASKNDAEGVMSSRDGGATFSSAEIGVGSTFVYNQQVVGSLSDDGAVMIVSSYGSVPQMSTDSGVTWSGAGLPSAGWTGFAVSDSPIPSRRIIAITENARVSFYGPIPVPTISTVLPDSGSVVGGQTVIISGEYFSNVVGVSFDATPVASFSVISQTTLSVVVPSYGSGSGDVNVYVTTESGTSNSTATFNYLPTVQPTLTSISPNFGRPSGGAQATIMGTGFRDLISVAVGGVVVDELIPLSENELRFVVPPGIEGTADVVLTTAGGVATLFDGFVYDRSFEAPEITWNSLGTKNSDNVGYAQIHKVVQSPDGSVYVAGMFENWGNEPTADYVAKWDGSSWSGLGSNGSSDGIFECGEYCFVSDIAIAANGEVFVSGTFSIGGSVDASGIARWDGTSWHALGQTTGGFVFSLDLDNLGNLYASGDFQNMGGDATADYLAKWDGTSWSGIGSNGAGDGALNDFVYSLAVGGGDSIYVSGIFTDVAGLPDADYIARWTGSNWQAMGPQTIDGEEFGVLALTMIVDSSSGVDVLYIGGCMGWRGKGGLSVARWSGSGWSEIAGTIRLRGCVYDLAFAPTGDLVAAGEYLSSPEDPGISGLAVWNGSDWRSLGESSNPSFLSVAVTPDSRLIVSGDFVDLNGNEDADYLAISNPLARLTPLGAAAVVAPNVGPDTGGTTVVLTGSHYSLATRVEFGSTPATSLKVLSDTSISVVTPAHSAGAVDVHLISDSGERVLAKGFTYIETVVSVMDTAEEVATLPEQTIVPNPDFVSGESQTFSVPGFVPGELVQVILASTPRLLTSAIADANGVATFTFTIPSDISGRHTLAVYAPVSGRGIRQIIEIAATRPVVAPANTLPKTGVAVEILWPMALLLSGMMLVSFSILRRRKIASEA